MTTKEKTGRTPVKQKKKPEKEAPRPLQDVVYMPPKPFMRNRLLLRLATVVAIVLALVLAMSVFFRVEHIQVSGMDQYTAWDILPIPFQHFPNHFLHFFSELGRFQHFHFIAL